MKDATSFGVSDYSLITIDELMSLFIDLLFASEGTMGR